MAKVIALEAYLTRKYQVDAPPQEQSSGEPHINDSQIWSRDYSKLENVVYGVLKIREVLNYYLYYEDVWAYLLLNLLDAALGGHPQGHAELREACSHLRNYVLQAVDATNRKNMYAVLLILDLIEKAPGFRHAMRGGTIQPLVDGPRT